MKTVKIVALVFILVGLAGLIGAFCWYVHEDAFLAQAKIGHGTVMALVPSQSSDSITYRPGVEFMTEDGVAIRFTSNSGSNPPSYSVGQKVEVYYPPSAPERAQIKGFFSQWGGPAVIGLIGTVFSCIGGGIFFFIAMGLKKKAWLKLHGVAVQATVKEIFLDTSITVNGRSPFRILAQWQDPATMKVYIFRSECIWFDPGEYVNQGPITVLIDGNDPKRYWMDLSFLPELA